MDSMETSTSNGDWVKEHIESRVERGAQWRGQFEHHKNLAEDFRYIRILGRKFRPVSISAFNPCGHLRDHKSDCEIMTCDSVLDAITKANSATERKPGANKPEHRLQAFLIRAAIRNELRFDHVMPDFSDVFDKLIFVTDELAVKPGDGEVECRADIIALGGKGERFFPIFIELKNERLLNKLKMQLNNTEALLWKHARARRPFCDFLSAVSGVPLEKIDQQENAAMKMIIWPKSPSGKEKNDVDEARKQRFLIVDFDPTYVFSRRMPQGTLN